MTNSTAQDDQASHPRVRPETGERVAVPGSLRPHTKVLPEHARGHNRALVLQELYVGAQYSRADLARQTGLTRVTISDLVAELIADGLVRELGPRVAAGPGKPATLLELDSNGHQLIALDLSGPEVIRGALFTLGGAIVLRRERNLEVPVNADAVIGAVATLATELQREASAPLLGLGVATPGLVDRRGIVREAAGFGWHQVALRHILEAELRIPAVVANDANAAVLAEHSFGAAAADSLLVRIERGVGAGILAGGRPLRGARNAAGEIGHIHVGVESGPQCVCGRSGCLEAWVSAPALRAAFARGDDPRTVYGQAGEHLVTVLAPIVAALDLSEVVLAGPRDVVGKKLVSATRQALAAHVPMRGAEAVEVRLSVLDEDVALRGAAVMVLAEQLGVV